METRTPRKRPNWWLVATAAAFYVVTIRYFFENFYGVVEAGEPLGPGHWLIGIALLLASFFLTRQALRSSAGAKQERG